MIIPNKKEFLADSAKYQALKEKFSKHLSTNYYDLYREWHYKDIEPRIFAEELLGEALLDYKIHCFGGVAHVIQVANSTHTNNDLFDTKWNRLEVTYLNPKSQIPPAKPLKLDCMLEIAQKLSLPLNYVRVDLYCVQEKIFVGELTFTPNCGTARFDPQTCDKELGALWHND